MTFLSAAALTGALQASKGKSDRERAVSSLTLLLLQLGRISLLVQTQEMEVLRIIKEGKIIV